MDREEVKKIIDKIDFIKDNNMSFESYENETLVLKMEPDQRHISDLNILHGGVIYSFADTATGILCRVLGKTYVTIEASMNYISNTKKGVEIFAKAKFIHKGNSISVVNVIVYTREKLLSVGNFTYHVYIKWVL